MKRNDILEKEDLIRQWIEENISKAEIARRLSCKADTLENYLKKMNIQYSGNKSGKNIKTFNHPSYIPFDIYIKVSKTIQTNKLRHKLIKEGLKEAKCERCGNVEWNGLPIPLEVHHKNGDKENNELNNLEILCPNCHAQTDFYRGKNIKSKNK